MTNPRLKSIINNIGATPRILLGVAKKGVNQNTRTLLKTQPCFYCGIKVNPKKLTLDHFVPRSFRGRNTIANLVASCSKCNNNKNSNLPTPYQIYKFHRLRPTISAADLLKPYGFLTEEQQVRMNWFLTIWNAHVAAYRLRKHENLPLLSKFAMEVP